MNDADRKAAIKLITATKGTGYCADNADDMAELNAMSDKNLINLRTLAEGKSKAEGDLKTAQEAKVEAEAKLKAAEEKKPEAKPLTRDEIFAADPSLKTIVTEHDARVAAEKKALIEKLIAASKVQTKEQLEAKSVEELRTLASYAKVEVPPADFSGRGIPMPRAAAEDNSKFAPPNPWASLTEAKK